MKNNYNKTQSGRSAGWIAHQHGGLGVGGSSPLAPTINFFVIVPAYNEERKISTFLEELAKIVPLEKVIVIDDGSTDHTYGLAKKTGCIVLKNKINSGKGAAQKAGFEEAMKRGAEYIITMDADLQHDPAYIPLFIDKIMAGYDIVIGSRWQELHKMPRDRYLSNRLATLAISLLTRRKIMDTQSGFRAIRSEVLKRIQLKTNKYETESELLIKALLKGFKVGYVEIEARYGDESSKINRFVDTLRFLRMYVGLVWQRG